MQNTAQEVGSSKYKLVEMELKILILKKIVFNPFKLIYKLFRYFFFKYQKPFYLASSTIVPISIKFQ